MTVRAPGKRPRAAGTDPERTPCTREAIASDANSPDDHKDELTPS